MKIMLLIPFICSLAFSKEPCFKKYKRKAQFGRWADLDRDGIHTRNQILISRNTDKSKLRVKRRKVKKGQWSDFYSSKTYSSPKQVSIDHVVPVSHVFHEGAKCWTQEQRVAFYNDEDNLVITSRSLNQSKGAKQARSWAKRLKAPYRCNFLKKWVYVKRKYKLEVKKKVLQEYVRCGGV